jgi:hypothetical protein
VSLVDRIAVSSERREGGSKTYGMTKIAGIIQESLGRAWGWTKVDSPIDET